MPATIDPDTLADRAAVGRLLAAGRTHGEIAAELGLDRADVRAHVRRLGRGDACCASCAALDVPPAPCDPEDLCALRLCLRRIGPLKAGQIEANLEWEPRRGGQVLAEARRRGLVAYRAGFYVLVETETDR